MKEHESQRKPKGLSASQLKFAVVMLIVVLFALGIIQIAQGFVDTRDYREKIVNLIEQQTHKKVTIKGTVSGTLLPIPTLYIPGLELRDSNNDRPAPALAVDLISIEVPFTALFSSKFSIASISLQHPVLEVMAADDSHVHLDWLNPRVLKSL